MCVVQVDGAVRMGSLRTVLASRTAREQKIMALLLKRFCLSVGFGLSSKIADCGLRIGFENAGHELIAGYCGVDREDGDR